MNKMVKAILAILSVSVWICPVQADGATRPSTRPAVTSSSVPPVSPRALVDIAVAAHGGTETWRTLGQATFEFEMQRFDTAGQPSGPPMPLGISFPTSGHAAVDGAMGDVRMRYKDGVTFVWNSHGEVSDPQMHAQARFMLPTFQYIFSLPWKLQDDGVVMEAIEGRRDASKELNGVRVTYKPGVGESPEDWYKFYFDAETDRLHDVLWIITAPGHDNTIEWCRFEDQRLVDGIWLPHQWTFIHAREDGEPIGPPAMRARLTRVSFSPEAPSSRPTSRPASRPASQPTTRPGI